MKHQPQVMGLLPLVVLAILIVHCTSLDFVPPAGKCRDNITTIEFDINELVINDAHWNAVFHPAGDAFSNLDSDHEDLYINANNEVHGTHRMKLKDNTIVEYQYRYYLGPDNVYLEEVTVEGKTLVFWFYSLYIVPGANAFLYYRCLKTGSVVDYDTRFITVPVGRSLSAAEEQELLDKDASYHFTGGIHKLDNKLSW